MAGRLNRNRRCPSAPIAQITCGGLGRYEYLKEMVKRVDAGFPPGTKGAGPPGLALRATVALVGLGLAVYLWVSLANPRTSETGPGLRNLLRLGAMASSAEGGSS